MRVEAGVDVRAPAALVFEMLSTPERLPQWNTTMRAARRVDDGPIGLGARAVAEGTLFGQRLESETEVVVFEPPRRFATRAIRGPRLQTAFHLEVQPYGTRLRVEAEGEVPGGALGAMVGERVLVGELRKSLERLRVLCEEEARRQAAAEPAAGGDPACWSHLPESSP